MRSYSPDLHPAWLVRTLGALLIVGGGLISVYGFRTVHVVVTRLRDEGVEEPRWVIIIASLLLLFAAILGLLVVASP